MIPSLIQGGMSAQESIGEVLASTSGTVLTGGATGAEGAWVELIASTADDATFLELFLFNPNATSLGRVDIAIGASGSEVIIIPDIPTQMSGARSWQAPISFKVAIPKGSRVAARYCATTTSTINAIGFVGNSKDQTYGQIINFDPTSTCVSVLTIDPGATANTKGSWTEFIASTAEDINYLHIGTHNASYNGTQVSWLADIGIGAAASEITILENLMFGKQIWDTSVEPITRKTPCNIPAGTRIAIRAQCNTITTPDRELNLSLMGGRN